MKTAIFNFIVLQVVVWAIVFSSDKNGATDEVSYAAISATWQVVNSGKQNNPDYILHYPSFHKLTLNIDGTYVRLINDETTEEGYWILDKSESTLTLNNGEGIKKYEIIQLPDNQSETFIIKENRNDIFSGEGIEYELIRS